jgi:hypothetical protein
LPGIHKTLSSIPNTARNQSINQGVKGPTSAFKSSLWVQDWGQVRTQGRQAGIRKRMEMVGWGCWETAFAFRAWAHFLEERAAVQRSSCPGGPLSAGVTVLGFWSSPVVVRGHRHLYKWNPPFLLSFLSPEPQVAGGSLLCSHLKDASASRTHLPSPCFLLFLSHQSSCSSQRFKLQKK